MTPVMDGDPRISNFTDQFPVDITCLCLHRKTSDVSPLHEWTIGFSENDGHPGCVFDMGIVVG